MQAEAEAAAEKLLEGAAAAVRAFAGIEPEKVVRTGVKSDEVVKLLPPLTISDDDTQVIPAVRA